MVCNEERFMVKNDVDLFDNNETNINGLLIFLGILERLKAQNL